VGSLRPIPNLSSLCLFNGTKLTEDALAALRAAHRIEGLWLAVGKGVRLDFLWQLPSLRQLLLALGEHREDLLPRLRRLLERGVELCFYEHQGWSPRDFVGLTCVVENGKVAVSKDRARKESLALTLRMNSFLQGVAQEAQVDVLRSLPL
jgi:hypothetical protein